MWGTGDTYEPDGFIDHAKVIEFDVQQLHSIKPASDHDWMTFTLNETTPVWIETSGPSGNTRMWLRDSQGNVIEYDDDDGGYGYFSKIIRTLSPGTYYIEIDEYGNNHEIPTYYVNLTNKADLIIYQMQAWDYYGAPYLRYGWPVTIKVVTKNQGSKAAGPFITGLYINTSPYSTPFGRWDIPSLNPESMVNSYVNVTFWVTGGQYLYSRADIFYSVVEKYESNNVLGPLWIYINP